jgi:histidine ammonia-lyase
VDLSIEDVVAVARSSYVEAPTVSLDDDARAKLTDVRAFMTNKWMTDDAPLIYSFNTGSGPFRDRRVLVADMAEAQRRGIMSHATGMGEPFAEDATRAMMLLRANSIAANYSGARPEVIDLILKFLNDGVDPRVRGYRDRLPG